MGQEPTDFFDFPGGRAALYQLRNPDGSGIDLSDYGATVVAVYTPGRDGRMRNVALSWADPARYITHPCFLGATVGRIPNRISGGRFTLDGVTYQMMLNDRNANTLHGGFGLSRRRWQVAEHSENHIVFSLTSPDGDGGFPGKLEISVSYTVTPEHKVILEYRAETDRKTVADFTNHTYFNLNGEDTGFCAGHRVRINAARRTAVDDLLIPTGETPEVSGSAYDLQDFRSFEDVLQDFPGGLDDNYIIAGCAGKMVNAAAVAESKFSGIRLTVNTDRPGIQFYMGNCTGGKAGRSGAYARFGGFCLETQNWPDAVNRQEFPSPVITPDKPFYSRTEWEFGIF